MATLLSGTSRNVPSILGFEIIFREDYKSLDFVSGLIIFPQYHFKPQDRNIPSCSLLRKSPSVYCLAYDIFGALSRSSYLCCIERMCPTEKWPCLKITKLKACLILAFGQGLLLLLPLPSLEIDYRAVRLQLWSVDWAASAARPLLTCAAANYILIQQLVTIVAKPHCSVLHGLVYYIMGDKYSNRTK